MGPLLVRVRPSSRKLVLEARTSGTHHDWHPEGHSGDERVHGHEGGGGPARSERRGDEMR